MTDKMKALLKDLADVFERHNAKVEIQDGEVDAYIRIPGDGWINTYFDAENEYWDRITADTFKKLLENGDK
jgi:hypothetical protein